jgi:hypothetical protein
MKARSAKARFCRAQTRSSGNSQGQIAQRLPLTDAHYPSQAPNDADMADGRPFGKSYEAATEREGSCALGRWGESAVDDDENEGDEECEGCAEVYEESGRDEACGERPVSDGRGRRKKASLPSERTTRSSCTTPYARERVERIPPCSAREAMARCRRASELSEGKRGLPSDFAGRCARRSVYSNRQGKNEREEECA